MYDKGSSNRKRTWRMKRKLGLSMGSYMSFSSENERRALVTPAPTNLNYGHMIITGSEFGV